VTQNFRALATLTMIALISVIGTGCGSNAGSETGTAGGSGSGGASKTTTRREKALRFSGCMRDHGVSAFPDPNASGELTIDAITNGSSVDTSSAAFKTAVGACKHLQPPGFTGRERSTREQEYALEFARCIRENGVPDFPDPAKGQPLVDTNRIPSSATSGGMTILNAAMRKCREFAEQAGARGGQ
jgi:hypothetical protein